MRQRHCVSHIDSTLVFLFESDIGRFLIESDAEPFQFGFNDSLVSEGFINV
jgi:hypothetical protein